MKLIDEIKGALKLEVRTPSGDNEQLEAVFQSKDLDILSAILKNNIGGPLKPPGQRAKFAGDVNKLVTAMGGIWHEQSLYLKKEENGDYVYATLWPWQSDPSRTTLKIGKGNFSSL